jgi:hypothetical protein
VKFDEKEIIYITSNNNQSYMSHALTRKCAHLLVKMFREGPSILTNNEYETLFCISITVFSYFISSIDPSQVSKNKSKYSQQTTKAPAQKSNSCQQTTNTSKKDSVTFKTHSGDHSMFAVRTRYSKHGLTQLSEAENEAVITKEKHTKSKIKQESFGFF